MKDINRDLLVLSRNSDLSPEELECQVQELNQLLYHIESFANFCIAHEIIDVNRYKIIRKPNKVQNALHAKVDKPFVFISNKN